MRRKVTIVGAGNVGATTAQRIFDRGYADVILVDIVEGLPQGKALDMFESGPILGSDAKCIGTNTYKETAESDIVVVTSGIARKPGMTRDDLLLTNMKIVTSVVEQTALYSPNSVHIIVTNPLDAMAQKALDVTGFPSSRVVGMAGILDTSRFKYFLSQELKVPVKNINTLVLGGHGDTMVPMPNRTTVNGKPLNQIIKKEKLDLIIDRTRKGGAEIVKLLEKGSAFYAPAASGIEMAESYIKDLKKTLPCAAYLNGEYGVKNLYAGVPVIIGSSGVEKVVEFTLNKYEKENFDLSIKAVKALIAKAKEIDPKLSN